MRPTRRAVLELFALSLLGCPPAKGESNVALPPPPDIVVDRLGDLLTVVALDWAILLSPARLWAIPWLEPSLRRILRDERLDALAENTGIDLRRARELSLASYDGGEMIAYLVRHPLEAIEVERRFRERLTSSPERVVHGHQLVTVWGNIGTAPRGFAAIGRDVAAFQYGGAPRKGALAVAVGYARKRLERIPTILGDPLVAALQRALGAPPIELFWPGPFEDDLARGARGLLAGASGFAIGAEPSSPGVLRLIVIIAGDYGGDPEALRFLELAWRDLAQSDLGHLLGLHEPRRAPERLASALGLELRVELDAELLISGLAAATVDNVRDIMERSGASSRGDG